MYNFEQIKSYIGWTEEDEKNLRTTWVTVKPRVSSIVAEFYRRVLSHSQTRMILKNPGQVERLKTTLAQWLEELFVGPYDEAYFLRRSRVGVKHVEVGLPA